MKTKATNGSPLAAWGATLPLALGFPAAGWVVFYAVACLVKFRDVSSADLGGILVMDGATVLVHFFAYSITGIPLFCLLYPRANSPVWTPWVGLPVGAVLGVAMFLMFCGGGRDVLREPALYLVGGGYGTITAIAALRQRPQPEPQ